MIFDDRLEFTQKHRKSSVEKIKIIKFTGLLWLFLIYLAYGIIFFPRWILFLTGACIDPMLTLVNKEKAGEDGVFNLTDISNPYRLGEPVADSTLLFGRQEAADWIGLQVNSNNQTLILSAVPLIGKSSFLRHVGALLNIDALHFLVSLSEIRTDEPGKKRKRTVTLNSVLQSVIEQLVPQLTPLDLIDTQAELTSSQVASNLRQLFAQASQNLKPGQRLMLYFDDLHALVTEDMAVMAGFLTSLMPCLDECPQLHLVFAVNQDTLKLIKHPLIDGAPTFNLGMLSLDASMNMITLPVKDILRFDYGVTKRIAEVNSHHPYYLSLFCHTLLNRQVQDGWVNQRDFDATLVEILGASIEPLIQIWEESNQVEQAILAGMAAIQGAHGPITNQEILRFLQKKNNDVVPGVVMNALQTLAHRGVLVPMGAVSYRFHVSLFRFWLRERADPGEILAKVNWNRAATQLASISSADHIPVGTGPRRSVMGEAQTQSRGQLFWPTLIGFVLGCALVTAGSAFAAQIFDLPIPFVAQPTPTATPTATPFSEEILPLLESESTPIVSETIEPTPTPTLTPPVVVTRTLPSIIYMGRDIDQNWLIYTMSSEGSDITLLSSEGGDDASPVWSPDGQKIAYVSRRDGNREVYVMDADGQNITNVTRHPADDWTPAWSPDGTQLAFSSFRDGSWEIFVMDTACLEQPESCPDNLVQLTTDGIGNLSPVWSPDGTRFAFSSKANGNWDIYTMATDGSDIRQVTSAPENDLAPAWSPDGSQIVFESNRADNVEIYVVDVNGGVARNITNLPLADDHGPIWSPDGQQLVFYSNREGNWDIFVTSIDGTEVTNLTQTPSRDEQTPAWRP